MAKQSGIDKVIKDLEHDIREHEREINAKMMLISRLRAYQPSKKAARPNAVKAATAKEEKTA